MYRDNGNWKPVGKRKYSLNNSGVIGYVYRRKKTEKIDLIKIISGQLKI